jgi:aryl-alcohol dehydrogenase
VLRDPARPYTIESVDVAVPENDEVLVRVVATGMCHTDLFGRGELLGPAFLPAVLGHEGAGVVEQVGSAVAGLAPGDHVVLTFDSCGACAQCLAAEPAYCTDFEARNLSGTGIASRVTAHDANGAPLTSRWFGQSSFAQYVIATSRNTIRVDPEAPVELLGPLGCGIQTGAGAVLNEMRLRAGDTLAVFGTGAVGLAAILAARMGGAAEIVAVDVNADRRALALELGATRAVDGADPDLVAAVRGSMPGLDFTLDTTARGDVMAAAVRALSRRGSCVLVGAGTAPLTIAPGELAGRHLTYVYEGSATPRLFIPRLIAQWRRGAFPFDRLITTYPLEEINAAEQDAVSGKTVKPVLIMPPTA